MDIKIRAIATLGRARDEIRKELAWTQIPLSTPEELELVIEAYQEADAVLTEVLERVMSHEKKD